ncbi:MAG: hypothetical protein J6D08_09150 [Lachnospiraceae bacterium]|nr:hypothetical protein [Lachnospiraceae bacterium]
MHEFMNKIVVKPKVINPYKFIEENRTDKYVLYGIGNLAEAVNKQFLDRGVKFELALVDDGYYIKENFMGLPVQKFEEFTSNIKSQKKYNLVIGYAAGYRKMQVLINEGFFRNVICIARPFEHHKTFDRKFVKKHEKQFEVLYQLLEDNESRENLCAFVNSRITENPQYVVDISKKDIDEFCNDVYEPTYNETFLDIGAYQGGSIQRFLKAAPADSISKVIGLEPEDNNFNKLCINLSYIDEKKKRLEKIGCYDKKTRLGFNNSADKCCRIDDNFSSFIDVDTIDNICIDEKNISTIYIGISAAVLEIIKGSKNTIIANKPRLIVNLGTMKEELFLIPLYIKEIEPSYKLYFRFQSSMPSRLFLYAVP